MFQFRVGKRFRMLMAEGVIRDFMPGGNDGARRLRMCHRIRRDEAERDVNAFAGKQIQQLWRVLVGNENLD